MKTLTIDELERAVAELTQQLANPRTSYQAQLEAAQRLLKQRDDAIIQKQVLATRVTALESQVATLEHSLNRTEQDRSELQAAFEQAVDERDALLLPEPDVVH